MKQSRKEFISTKRSKKRPKTWLYAIFMLAILCTGVLTSLFYLRPQFLWNTSSESGGELSESEFDNKRSLTIYFPENGELTPTKTKPSLKLTRTGVAEDVAKEYLKQYNSQLNNCFLSTRGVAYLDISEDLRKNFSGSVIDEYLFIMGLLKSLKENISGIKSIRILIDGSEIESLGGHIDLTYPIREK